MALPRLNFSKLWTNAEHFPTVESSEAKVRSDMQLLHDETRAALNALAAALEAQTGAESLGVTMPAVSGETKPGNLQQALDALSKSIISSGTMPSGGKAGQFLGKTGSEDHEISWVDLMTDQVREIYGLDEVASPSNVLAKLGRASVDKIGDIRYSTRSEFEEGWLPCDGRTIATGDLPGLDALLTKVGNDSYYEDEFELTCESTPVVNGIFYENGVEILLVRSAEKNYLLHRGGDFLNWTVKDFPFEHYEESKIGGSKIRWCKDQYVYVPSANTLRSDLPETKLYASTDLATWDEITISAENLPALANGVHQNLWDIVYGDGHYMLVIRSKDGAHHTSVGFSDALEGPYDFGNKTFDGPTRDYYPSVSYANGYFFYTCYPDTSSDSAKSFSLHYFDANTPSAANGGAWSVSSANADAKGYLISPVYYADGTYFIRSGNFICHFTTPGVKGGNFSIEGTSAAYEFDSTLWLDEDSGELVAFTTNNKAITRVALYNPKTLELLTNYEYNYNFGEAIRAGAKSSPVLYLLEGNTVKIRRYKTFYSRQLPALINGNVHAYIKAENRDVFAGNEEG